MPHARDARTGNRTAAEGGSMKGSYTKPVGKIKSEGGANEGAAPGGYRDNARPNSPSSAGTKLPGF